MVDLQELTAYLSELADDINEGDGVWGISYNAVEDVFEICINPEYFIEVAEEFYFPLDEIGVLEAEQLGEHDPLKYRIEFYAGNVLYFSYLTDREYKEFKTTVKEYRNGHIV